MKRILTILLLLIAWALPAHAFFADSNSDRFPVIQEEEQQTTYLDMDSVHALTFAILTQDKAANTGIFTQITVHYAPLTHQASYTIDSLTTVDENGKTIKKEKMKGDAAQEQPVVEDTNMYDLAQAVYLYVMGSLTNFGRSGRRSCSVAKNPS